MKEKNEENKYRDNSKIVFSLVWIAIFGIMAFFIFPKHDIFEFEVVNVVEKEYYPHRGGRHRGVYEDDYNQHETHKWIYIYNKTLKESSVLISTPKQPIDLSFGQKFSKPNPDKTIQMFSVVIDFFGIILFITFAIIELFKPLKKDLKK